MQCVSAEFGHVAFYLPLLDGTTNERKTISGRRGGGGPFQRICSIGVCCIRPSPSLLRTACLTAANHANVPAADFSDENRLDML
jgi:hypothetical protein